MQKSFLPQILTDRNSTKKLQVNLNFYMFHIFLESFFKYKDLLIKILNQRQFLGEMRQNKLKLSEDA